MKLKAALNMSVIICLPRTQSLMQSEPATLTQLAEGEFLDDERKELTKMCPPMSGCGQEYFQILCKVERYGLLLKAASNMSVIICLVTTQRLMQSGSATLTQMAEGEFLDDERKELTKMCSPMSGCGQEYFQILCNVELYGLLLNAPPSKSRN
jgi:hypothetical protein